MEDVRRNLMVGLFVLVGLGALGTLIVLFGRGPTWLTQRGTYPLNIRFAEVSGIRAGTLVTVKGITIGRVENVELVSDQTGAPPQAGAVGGATSVNVTVGIEPQFTLPAGSVAQTTEPMLGQGRPPIVIIPGPPDAAALPPGATIAGTMRRALDSLLPGGAVTMVETTARQVGEAAEALTPVLQELKTLVERRTPENVDLPGGPQGNVASAVTRMDSALRHFNEVLGDPEVKSQLRETIANAREMSERGKKMMTDLETAATDARAVMDDARQFVANADQTVSNLDARVTEVARATQETLDRTDQFLDHLNVVGRQLTAGEGNLGKLIMDNKLYEAMLVSAERLALAVEDFRGMIKEWREGKIRVGF